jgi:hypothetical protein
VFQSFIQAMEDHYPSNLRLDGRMSIFPEHWPNILHPTFSGTASMLSQMHTYVLPEWGSQLDLDAKHVHEDLMCLLLKEIICINDTGSDVTFNSQIRVLPSNLRRDSSFRDSATTASLSAYTQLPPSTCPWLLPLAHLWQLPAVYPRQLLSVYSKLHLLVHPRLGRNETFPSWATTLKWMHDLPGVARA